MVAGLDPGPRTGRRSVAGGKAAGPVSLRLVTQTDPTREPGPTSEPGPVAAPVPGPADAGRPAAADGSAAGSAAPGGHRPTGAINQGPVTYKGAPLDAERGPGLGCFRFQLIVLVALIVLTPLSVGRVPDVVTALLLFATLGLLLVSGQTIIFLLRLVAADRRGRREPLAPRSPTVGQLEGPDGSDVAPSSLEAAPGATAATPSLPAAEAPAEPPSDPPTSGAVRQ